MTGQHVQKLLRATASSDHQKLLDSSDAWLVGYDALDLLAQTLDTTAIAVEVGFSDGVSADEQGTAKRGRAAFETLRDDVVIPRRDQMESAAKVLLVAAGKLKSAELARADMPDEPGDLPPRPSSYGTEDDIDALRAQRIYDNTVTRHNTAVAAFADADEKARKKLESLDQAYDEASAVLAEIHGEPVYPEDLPPPGEAGPGGFPVAPTGGPRPVPVPVPHPVPTVEIPGPGDGPGLVPGPGTGAGPGHPGPGPVGGTLGNPGQAPGPGSPGGSGPGIHPIAAGALAAGVFGGPGVIKAVRGAFGARGAFGSAPGTIGSTTRTGGSGTLGRAGTGTPGSPVSRGAGRGAGGGAGGGRPGVGGTAGGRGRGGGRGATGAVTGGRGRPARDEEGRERDLFDDGSDWVDDEGAGPDVLG